MNKKVLTLSAVMASMLFGAAAHAADTRIRVTIYKYDDNFMSVVRKAIEQDAKAAPDVQVRLHRGVVFAGGGARKKVQLRDDIKAGMRRVHED